MSRIIVESPIDNSPGLQYPSDINLDPSNPTGFALKNVYDNLFYLRRIVDANKSSNSLTKSQIEALIRASVNRTRITGVPVIVGTHNERITTYAAASQPVGTEFYETDRISTYVISAASGTKKWTYVAGSMIGLIAARPGDLGTADAGFLFTSITTDQETQYLWDGAEFVTVGGYLQEIQDAVTAAITTSNVRRHLTSGNPTTGFGIGEVEELEDSAHVTQTASFITTDWSSAGTNTARRRWWLRVAGVITQLLELTSTALTLAGNFIWFAGGSFSVTLTHTATGNRVVTVPDDTGTLVYETAALPNNNFLLGAGNSKIKDAGYATLPIANGGTGSTTAAGARGALSAALLQAPGAHTITLAAITGGGTQGSITWTAEGVISGFVDPT